MPSYCRSWSWLEIVARKLPVQRQVLALGDREALLAVGDHRRDGGVAGVFQLRREGADGRGPAGASTAPGRDSHGVFAVGRSRAHLLDVFSAIGAGGRKGRTGLGFCARTEVVDRCPGGRQSVPAQRPSVGGFVGVAAELCSRRSVATL